MVAYRSVLITGASSGLGRALAEASAAPGVVLHLCGRNAERLESAAGACQVRGAVVHARVLDVTDQAAMAAWIAGAGPLDLVVANAGISAGTGDRGGERLEDEPQVRTVFAVNLVGMLNTVLPAIAAMRAQPPGPDGVRGRIAAVASIAALVPAPGAPTYCASKAAVDTWTVAAAEPAARAGILLTSLCPGYVRTAMTAHNRFPMPGLMDADRAARIMLRGIAAGRRRVAFPWWMGLAARLGGLLPPALVGRLLAGTPGKQALIRSRNNR
jgi:NAD(P)-dependent dehydrogenase (short-subunit alcohol dehydrogenase family)